MSTATITPALRAATGPVRPEIRRPVRQPGTARGPVARPVRPVPTPPLRFAQRPVARSCQVEMPVSAGSWRLTDRGIALVLVLAVMIVVAAATVIGLTAWQVTSTDYQPAAGVAAAAVRAR